MLKGDDFEAMLLCWPPQACSPVHAHSDATTGVKSNCFMAVLQGVALLAPPPSGQPSPLHETFGTPQHIYANYYDDPIDCERCNQTVTPIADKLGRKYSGTTVV